MRIHARVNTGMLHATQSAIIEGRLVSQVIDVLLFAAHRQGVLCTTWKSSTIDTTNRSLPIVGDEKRYQIVKISVSSPICPRPIGKEE